MICVTKHNILKKKKKIKNNYDNKYVYKYI